MKDVAVLVVGAGPVGLVAALKLAQAGLDVALVEREAGPAPDFRASTFHPPTLEMLDELDLAAPLLALGLRSPTWQIRIHETGERAVFDLACLAGDTVHPYRLQCEQHHLTRLAAAKAAVTSGLDLRYGHALESIRQDGDGVTAEVRDAAGRLYPLTARYAIAADGARSVVRESVGAPFEGETYPETTILATTPYPFETRLAGLSNVNYVWCDQGTFSLLRLPHFWRCSLCADAGETVEQALTLQAIERKLQRIAPRDEPYEVTEARPYRVHRRLVDRYRYGRIVFAGDAAHLTSPSGGMGMNGGIHDAVSLADKLAAIVRDGRGADLLDLYHRQRRPIAEEDILAQANANRARMQRTDPEWRRAEMKRLQGIAADPALLREHLLRTSMISGLRRAEAIA